MTISRRDMLGSMFSLGLHPPSTWALSEVHESGGMTEALARLLAKGRLVCQAQGL